MAEKIMDAIGRTIGVVGWFTVLVIYILTIVILSPIPFLDFLPNEEY